MDANKAVLSVRAMKGSAEHTQWLDWLAALERSRVELLKMSGPEEYERIVTEIKLLDSLQKEAVRESRQKGEKQ